MITDQHAASVIDLHAEHELIRLTYQNVFLLDLREERDQSHAYSLTQDQLLFACLHVYICVM